MVPDKSSVPPQFYSHFKVFLELMTVKVREILLVSSAYDAFIMEEDGSLASRIINEYSGLNLSQPPRVTRTSSAYTALEILQSRKFDLVITMPHVAGMDAWSLAAEIKALKPDLPVILLAHSLRDIQLVPDSSPRSGIDKVYIWSGNSDLLLALVKNAEDRMNVDYDTYKAQVRVLVMVEDSPVYYSSFLPLLYKEIVKQTQAVLEVGLNEEHRLLTMRARPKILLAGNYEEAMGYCRRYRQYLFGLISDTRIPRRGQLDPSAGLDLLSLMKQEVPDLPLLLMSSEPENRARAERIPATFMDKNSRNLHAEIRNFFVTQLGFGDFVFRTPAGAEVRRARDLRALQEAIADVPEESLWYHASRNHFSNWIMGRAEIALASNFREVRASEFQSADELRRFLISNIRTVRKWRQKGVVAQFKANNFDAEVMDFLKIGHGSLGGKARGLAFMSAMLQQNSKLHEKYAEIHIDIPQTLVITTDGFESFVTANDLRRFAGEDFPDARIRESFLQARMPEWLLEDLRAYLGQVRYPLSVRSSSLLEDAHFQPYAGLYETYMIPNNHPDLEVRLQQLVTAIKRVYASTYYEDPKAFACNVCQQPQEEAMAVIIQQLVGEPHGDYFYPAVGGVAQSHNFYPVGPMKSEDGIAYMALGLGRAVVEGEKTLRFSPGHPRALPQFSTVEDILENAQRYFYALRIRNYPPELNFDRFSNLARREVSEAAGEHPVRLLTSAYLPDENRIRDSGGGGGARVLTFAPIIKYNIFPLAELARDLLAIGSQGMGCPVDIEYSVNLPQQAGRRNGFYFLQLRPMATDIDRMEVRITEAEWQEAFCRSTQALGNGRNQGLADIVFVKPEDFRLEATRQMADEIGRINAALHREKRPYLLIGPGRWGSADRWLGIPVRWQQISGVGAIVEVRNAAIQADPSQGSHFFQNITSLGIQYLTVNEGADDFIDWHWLTALPTLQESVFVRHVRLSEPLVVKIDGRNSHGIIFHT